ncbi:MAG: hypothetical protein MMC33_005091 [Icmadophila ericetorum]|nr:hypothetical protein [Icmadophila ericetorum]
MKHDNLESGVAAANDSAVLARAGKKEVMKREWGFFPILCFSATVLATWEGTSAVFISAFVNGGPVSVVYGFIISAIGTVAIGASFAEMASMSPVAGAQYHWTAEHSPRRARAILSWIQGWMTVLAWQVVVASVMFLNATMIQALIIWNNANYTAPRWHATLLMIAFSAWACVFNTIGKRFVPIFETLAGCCHVIFFFIIMISMLATSTKASNDAVWKSFVNGGGWPSDGVSFCIGFLTPAFALAGIESIVHMSEETKNAAINIPRAMILSVGINGLAGFAYILTVLYSINDLDAVFSNTTGYPIIEVFYQATGNLHAATAMLCGVLVVFIMASVAILASASRLTWAFARDQGLPFSSFLAHINPTLGAPVRAVILNFVLTVLLSLINIGSTTAFNALISLATLALYISYGFPIVLLVIRRLRGHNIEFGPWSMGKFGIFANVVAIAFCTFLVIFLPFPTIIPVTAQNMNYAVVVFAGVMLWAVASWFVSGRRRFVGPIQEMSVTDVSSDSSGIYHEHVGMEQKN